MSDWVFWAAMAAVAFVTSVLSGVLGLAGGMLLLAVLLFRLEPMVAIPVHGVVQLVSNASRGWFLRRHVEGRFVRPFALPLLPAAAAGLWVLGSLSPHVGRMLIGAFVLAATWRMVRLPGAAGARGAPLARAVRLLPVGGVLIGFCSTVVGATGPLLAPFIMALHLTPQGMVGTIAACQVFQHAAKLAVFGAAGFDFGRHALPALTLSACAVFGSAVGTRSLDRVPRDRFERIVRVVLTLLALQLLAGGAWGLVG